MPRLSNKEFAKNVGEAIAKSMFNDMLNVQFQGQNFSWKSFPSNFKGLAYSKLFMHMKTTPKNMPELQEITANAFEAEAQRLIDDYVKDNPLPTKD